MNTIATLALTALLVALASPGLDAAEARIEGTVVSTALTACDFKPGTCEGSLVLDTKAKGGQVAITYVNDKGMRVAKSIEVKAPKP